MESPPPPANTKAPDSFHWTKAEKYYVPVRFRYRPHPTIAHLQVSSDLYALCGFAHSSMLLPQGRTPLRPCRRCKAAFIKRFPDHPWPPNTTMYMPGLPDVPEASVKNPRPQRGKGGRGVGGVSHPSNQPSKHPSNQPTLPRWDPMIGPPTTWDTPVPLEPPTDSPQAH